MSQRILKCTVCGGDHSRFHCLVLCNSCNGDKRNCSCESQSQPKRKRKAPQSKAPNRKRPAEEDREVEESDEPPSYQELDKLYVNLVKRHEKVGKAFQTLQEQNEALAKELEEKEKENEAINHDAEELVDLVRTKNGVVADLQKSLQEAKATIVELKEEVQRLRRQQTDQNAEDEPTRDQNQNRVSTNSLATIHQRYEEVLSVLQENSCSMANAFRLSGCPRSTLRDFVAIAELKIDFNW